jgi:uncharacterized membrane protein YecN with MAPEG domain
MITLLYVSLLGLLQVTLAYKVGSSRLKTNTLLGDGNQSEVLQKVRAHGNLTEYVPIFLILLALIEMQGVALWKIHVLARIAHSYGMYISTESTPPRLIGILVTWFSIAGMSIYGLINYILNSMM